MRQDFFEYTPQFKLLFLGNHKPGLRSSDEAMRRRFHLIPFTVTVPENERDPTLGLKLLAELPGIMHWAVKGCVSWQKIGLKPPETVRAATAEYLDAEDAIITFIDEHVRRDVNGFEPTAKLYDSWKIWTERCGEYTGSQKAFVERLSAKGFAQTRRMTARGFLGLRLNPLKREASSA
jgi:putative DNA primase/helicase